MITRVGSIGELSPRPGFEIVFIEPRDPTGAVSIGEAANEVELSVAKKGAGGATPSVFGNLRARGPGVGFGVVEVKVGDGSFGGIASSEGSRYEDSSFVFESLEVVEFDRRGFSCGPGLRGGIEDIDGLNAASSESVELFGDFDEGVFVALVWFAFGLDFFPRGSGFIG